jgi:mannose-1-phosphate guanylyltransferase
MKPICYRNNKDGECFKVTLLEGLTLKQNDTILDAINFKEREFITEEEFNSFVPETMDISIMDFEETAIVGTLTCRWMDMSEFEELDHIIPEL